MDTHQQNFAAWIFASTPVTSGRLGGNHFKDDETGSVERATVKNHLCVNWSKFNGSILNSMDRYSTGGTLWGLDGDATFHFMGNVARQVK